MGQSGAGHDFDDFLGADGYRRLLDTAPDAMVVVDHRSRIVFVNTQTEKLFGYPRVELLGQPLERLIPERFHAGHQAHVARFFAAPTVRTMGSGLSLFGVRRDGSELPIEVSLSPLSEGGHLFVSAAIRDITERRRIEAAAQLSASRLASAVESIQDAFALFDADDRLVQCNSTYRTLTAETLPGPLLGRSYADILAASTAHFVFDSDGARARFIAERMAERLEPRGPHDVRTRDGRSLRIANRRTPEGGVVQTIWDLTDDVRREQELGLARIAAEAGSAAKSEFLSSMSHELRTPLNAILGFAQLLQHDRKERLSDRHRDRVAQILRGGEHLLRLINDILDLSRIEAGQISLSNEPVEVVPVLDEVLTTLGPAATRAGVSVFRNHLAVVPSIFADRTRFAQILINFGSNAIKYNRPGGSVTFDVSAPTDAVVRVTVRDTGLGIPVDKQAKLFQPFQRAGQETGPIEGTGIGLTITRRLAERMGGSVGFRSVPSEGSEFWVELPAHQDLAPHAPSTPERGSLPPLLDSGSRGLVLYVEDNPANVSFMRDLLGVFEDIELLVATTAEEGVELARRCRPRVILMDINLPGMSGLDALKVLRGWPETADTPVIALTAAASERDRQKGEQAGFYRYLTKPVKVPELEAVLEGLLGANDTGAPGLPPRRSAHALPPPGPPVASGHPPPRAGRAHGRKVSEPTAKGSGASW